MEGSKGQAKTAGSIEHRRRYDRTAKRKVEDDMEVGSKRRPTNMPKNDKNPSRTPAQSSSTSRQAQASRRTGGVGAAKQKESVSRGKALYKSLQAFVLNDDQLRQNNYPRDHELPDQACTERCKHLRDEEEHKLFTSRKCDRCKSKYKTDRNGKSVNKEEMCRFHTGKQNSETKLFSCCGQQDGCDRRNFHVAKLPLPVSYLEGFVKGKPDRKGAVNQLGTDSWDIIGLDCEMVYTTHGRELVRVTIVGVNRQVLYGEYV